MLNTLKEINKKINMEIIDKECDASIKTTIITNMLIYIDDKKLKEIFNKEKIDYISNIVCKCDCDNIKNICNIDNNSIMNILLLPLYDYIIIIDDTVSIAKLHLIKEIVKIINNLYTLINKESVSLISFLYTDMYIYGEDIIYINNILDNIIPHDHGDNELKIKDLEKTIDFFLHLITDEELSKPVKILYLTDDTGIFLNDIGLSKCNIIKEKSKYGENILSFITINIDKLINIEKLINFML